VEVQAETSESDRVSLAISLSERSVAEETAVALEMTQVVPLWRSDKSYCGLDYQCLYRQSSVILEFRVQGRNLSVRLEMTVQL